MENSLQEQHHQILRAIFYDSMALTSIFRGVFYELDQKK